MGNDLAGIKDTMRDQLTEVLQPTSPRHPAEVVGRDFNKMRRPAGGRPAELLQSTGGRPPRPDRMDPGCAPRSGGSAGAPPGKAPRAGSSAAGPPGKVLQSASGQRPAAEMGSTQGSLNAVRGRQSQRSQFPVEGEQINEHGSRHTASSQAELSQSNSECKQATRSPQSTKVVDYSIAREMHSEGLEQAIWRSEAFRLHREGARGDSMYDSPSSPSAGAQNETRRSSSVPAPEHTFCSERRPSLAPLPFPLLIPPVPTWPSLQDPSNPRDGLRGADPWAAISSGGQQSPSWPPNGFAPLGFPEGAAFGCVQGASVRTPSCPGSVQFSARPPMLPVDPTSWDAEILADDQTLAQSVAAHGMDALSRSFRDGMSAIEKLVPGPSAQDHMGSMQSPRPECPFPVHGMRPPSMHGDGDSVRSQGGSVVMPAGPYPAPFQDRPPAFPHGFDAYTGMPLGDSMQGAHCGPAYGMQPACPPRTPRMSEHPSRASSFKFPVQPGDGMLNYGGSMHAPAGEHPCQGQTMQHPPTHGCSMHVPQGGRPHAVYCMQPPTTQSGLPPKATSAGDGGGFGVVCGPSDSVPPAAVQNVGDLGPVSRRLNDLLSVCRTRLQTSRRSAHNAESKLHVAEKDLLRLGKDWRDLENELEVVCKNLVDSDSVGSTQSHTPSSVAEEQPLERSQRDSKGAGSQEKVSATSSADHTSREDGPLRPSSASVKRRTGAKLLQWLESQERAVAANEPELRSLSSSFFLNVASEALKQQDGVPNQQQACAKPASPYAAAQQPPSRASSVPARHLRSSTQAPATPRGPVASDYLKMATVPPPRPYCSSHA